MNNPDQNRAPVFFIRGYNSYPTDDLRFGPLTFGPAHAHVAQSLRQNSYIFHPLSGMGRASIEEQTAEAEKQIREKLQDLGAARFHLIGHSAGGIVSRALAHRFLGQEKALSITTITSPHLGSRLAKIALETKIKKPLLYKTYKMFGYDLEQRRPMLQPLLPETMAEFNRNISDLPHVHYGSVVAGLPFSRLPIGMMAVYRHAHSRGEESDGLVEKNSQRWGETLAELELDHGSVLGYSMTLSRKRKQAERRIFGTMMTKIIDFLQRAERGNL